MQARFGPESIIDMARQLPPEDQIKIVARLSEGLVQTLSDTKTSGRLETVPTTDLVARLRDSAIIPSRPTDAVQTLREIREARLDVL